MAEEEGVVKIEVEAMQAVYGDDCVVVDSYPPNLHLHIKPRTADVSSQQFVEAVIGIRAGSQYPEEPPVIHLIESKGLDEQRQKHLICSIQEKACELSSCLMLVALCEEAVEVLSAMNHPDGDCPLCLHPLVSEGDQTTALPFMKLMSCFHCFHSECIIRWWNWLQTEKETNDKELSGPTIHTLRDMRSQEDKDGATNESMGSCPVCRTVFHAKDLEHVLDLVGTHSSQLSSSGNEDDGDDNDDDDVDPLQSDSENMRRQKFEAILKLQEERSGLIEPKKPIAVLPGMYVPRPVESSPASAIESNVQYQTDATMTAGTNSSGSSNRPASRPTNKHWNSGMRTRKPRVRNSRKQVMHWVRKDNGGDAD